MTLLEFQIRMTAIDRLLRYGCGNHGCQIHSQVGWGTNAICKCTPREFSKELLEIAAELEKDGPRWKLD